MAGVKKITMIPTRAGIMGQCTKCKEGPMTPEDCDSHVCDTSPCSDCGDDMAAAEESDTPGMCQDCAYNAAMDAQRGAELSEAGAISDDVAAARLQTPPDRGDDPNRRTGF